MSCAAIPPSKSAACSPRSTPHSTASRCTACAARSLKPRLLPPGFRSGSFRFPGRVRTKSTSSGWPRLAREPWPRKSTPWPSAIFFLKMCGHIASSSLHRQALSRFSRSGKFPTDALAREMIAGGLRARLSCVDTKQLPAAFAGREFNLDLLRDLPPEADPCGERGEFHTCVYAGPMFSATLPVATGEVVTRDGFTFADFTMPAAEAVSA